jgi:hypothetical protein
MSPHRKTQPTTALPPSKSCISTLVCSESFICKAWEGGTCTDLSDVRTLRQFNSTSWPIVSAHHSVQLFCLLNRPFNLHSKTLMQKSHGISFSSMLGRCHFHIQWPILTRSSSLFMLGSPFAVFLHINQAQLIARKVHPFPSLSSTISQTHQRAEKER